MRQIHKYLLTLLTVLMMTLSLPQVALAHLMVAQHGSLNIVGDGAFMVLSLPASAFEDIDENGDGDISMIELNNGRMAIIQSVKENVKLFEEGEDRSLQGVLLSVDQGHGPTSEPISQIVVIGKFALQYPQSPLDFHVGLYGKEETERKLEISATRQSNGLKAALVLSPKNPRGLLLNSEQTPI